MLRDLLVLLRWENELPCQGGGRRFSPNHQEGCIPAAFQRGIGQRDARFGFSADDGGGPTVALGEHRGIREDARNPPTRSAVRR